MQHKFQLWLSQKGCRALCCLVSGLLHAVQGTKEGKSSWRSSADLVLLAFFWWKMEPIQLHLILRLPLKYSECKAFAVPVAVTYLPFLVSSSHPSQLPDQLEWCKLVARGGVEMLLTGNKHDWSSICHGPRVAGGKVEAEQLFHWHWSHFPENTEIKEAFLNKLFHLCFKRKAASEVMQWFSDDAFTIKPKSVFYNGI